MRLEKVNSIYTILTSLIIIILPMGLVIVQPDLGTSLLIAISGIAVFWFAGINNRYFIYTMMGFIIALPFIIAFLKPYQKLRVLTFLNHDRDPLGAGYQIIQSKIAVGSGGLSGKGFLQGTQTGLNFVPIQTTDFIFSVLGEEFGFLGSIFFIILYLLFLYRILYLSENQKDKFGRVFGYSTFCVLIFHFSINISNIY